MLQHQVIGHLGGDAEKKEANGREFITFRVADTSSWTDDAGVKHESTTWVDCVISGASNLLPYLKKGQQVYCSGSGTLRVYSSAKDRCMKPGLTINVRQCELLGSRPDDVPSKLYSADGAHEYAVGKYFHAAELVRDVTQPEVIYLLSRSNEQYEVNREGWVKKSTPSE